ncbi:hypothetical protein, partial [Roseovarius sp. 2305UL8-3]|uniref:hypothetical protein n=1 Tax=Roseovarius conchicola TaxID=3121636 RepID=UPI003528B37C
VLLLIVASPLSAGDCRPDGMSDKEAERIITIATEQGQSFRAAIDKIRADGLTYSSDSTYDDLMADPERALALANERHQGRESSLYNYSPERIQEMGASVDGFVEDHIVYWVRKENVNFFADELSSHLKDLAIQLGGKPTESNYRYQTDARTFIFALGKFAESAELKYIKGSIAGGTKLRFIRYRFSEKWTLKSSLEGRKPNYLVSVFLTIPSSGEEVTFDEISFGGVNWLKSSWPTLEKKGDGCLASF